ncbi:MAG: hypothetical protein GY940_13440 [bacterium]|nr:hypothetical protein [bacterium]
MAGKIIEKQLSDAGIAISNGTEDLFIRTALEPYEYTMDRMLAGMRLVEKARTFYHRHLEEKYQQAKAWEELENLWDQGLIDFRRFRAIAKQALRGKSDLWKSLALGTQTKKTISGFLDQARIFYTNALGNKAILDALAGFGVKPGDLKAAAKGIEKIEKAQANHKRKKAATHLAVKKRDQAVFKVKEWMIPYWNICRLALAGHPEQLGKLKYKK